MKIIYSILSLTCFVLANTSAQEIDSIRGYSTPEDLIKDIYVSVSAKNSEAVDWQKVRSMFIDEAVVILRTSKDKSTQFTADGFIQDFKDFYQWPEVKANGFGEKILNLKSMVYKDIAYVATVYSAAINNSKRPPTKGVDLWLLAKKDGLWKIISVVNEVVPGGENLPDLPEWKF
jgi:ketosteroid isomerase-like protein